MSKAIATQDPQSTPVPELYHPPMDLDAADIALPTIKIGQDMSVAVQEGPINRGDIFTQLSADDPDPQFLVKTGEPIRFHVLSLRKGKSVSVDGRLQTFGFNDPDAPDEAWTTYTYTVVLPDVDQDVPYKVLFTKTGRPAAQVINMALMRNAGKAAPWASAFTLSSAPATNKKGQKYFVPRVNGVEAKAADVELAASMAQRLAPADDALPTRDAAAEPAI